MSEIHRAFDIQIVTIENGQTTSDAVDGEAHAAYGLMMPAAFTGTSITFSVSADGVTYGILRDKSNLVVTVTVAVSTPYDLPEELAPWRYWKIVSSAAEGAQRLLVVAKKS